MALVDVEKLPDVLSKYGVSYMRWIAELVQGKSGGDRSTSPSKRIAFVSANAIVGVFGYAFLLGSDLKKTYLFCICATIVLWVGLATSSAIVMMLLRSRERFINNIFFVVELKSVSFAGAATIAVTSFIVSLPMLNDDFLSKVVGLMTLLASQTIIVIIAFSVATVRRSSFGWLRVVLLTIYVGVISFVFNLTMIVGYLSVASPLAFAGS